MNGKQICKNENSSKLQELCSFKMLNIYCYYKYYNEEPLEIGEEDNFERVDKFYKCLLKYEE